MIADAQNQLSAAQAVTSTAVSTNTIDLSVARDVGAGEELHIVVTVDTTATAAGAATVNFQVITSAAANLGSPNVIGETGAVAISELPAGRRPIVLPLPRSLLTSLPLGQRYLGLQYTVATGPLTAGAFTANVVIDPQDIGKNYPIGFTVA